MLMHSFSAKNTLKLYIYFYFYYLCNNCVQDRIFRPFQGGTIPFERRIRTNCIFIFIFSIYAIILCKTGFSVVFKAGPFLFSAEYAQIVFLFLFLVSMQ